MNTALISAVTPDIAVANKAASRRQTETSAGDPDAGGFAGVLANQEPHRSDSPGLAGRADTERRDDGRITAGQASDSQEAGAQVAKRHSDDNASTLIRTGKPGLTLQGDWKHSGIDDSSHKGFAFPGDLAGTGDPDSDAGLPDRFRQIIAALPRHAHNTGATANADGDAADPTRNAPLDENDKAQPSPFKAALAGRGVRSDTWQHQTQLARRSAATVDTNAAGINAAGKSASAGGATADDARPAALTAFAVPEAGTNARSSDFATARLDSGFANSGVPGDGNPNALSMPSFTSSLATSETPATMTVDVARTLNSSQWAPEFGRQFASMIRHDAQGRQVAELRLDPPELGPLRVTINLNDSVVQATFSSAHASVRNAVEQALPHLQHQLEQQGLSLGQTSVGHQDDAQAQSGGDGHQSETRDSASTTAATAGTHDAAKAQLAPRPSHRPDALLDTFA